MVKATPEVAAVGKNSKKVVKSSEEDESMDDFTKTLIRDLNKEFGQRVAYNLSVDEAPTIVKRWLDTGSVQMNYAIRNSAGGGYPEGRVIEISGPPSIGKSHLAYHAAAVTQAMGGLVVYIDTENATPIEKLRDMGINVAKKFVYCDTHCTEEVFSIIESTVLKAKQIVDKKIPILVIWDSVAASSPKAELEGEYDQNTVGLQARVISKGMRKLTGVIGKNNVTLLCLNQLRTAIGVTHGDPDITPGGKAIPYHATLRIRLTSGTQVKDKKGNVIGIHVIMTTKKNKVSPPFRKYFFDIIFGKGIVEDEFVFDVVRAYCAANKVTTDYKDSKGNASKVDVSIDGTTAWKEFKVSDSETGEIFLEKKFYKSEFGTLRKDPEFKPWIDKIIDAAYTIVSSGESASNSEGDSPTEDEVESDEGDSE